MITVFTATHCPNCRRVKAYLDQKGLEYQEVSIEEDKEAQRDIVERGFLSVPVVKIKDVYFAGFNRAKIDELTAN